MNTYLYLFVNVICITFAYSENDQVHRDWLESDWLKPIEAGDSRPAWWVDVWGGDGMLVEAIISDGEDGHKNKQVEILKLKNDGETSRIKMIPISIKINTILSISDSLKMEDLGLKNGEKIVVYYLIDSKYGLGVWNKENPFKKGNSFVFFVDRVGAIMPGAYHLKWTMENTRVNNLSEIIKARDSHLGRRSISRD